jgi:hypothetical protein
MARQLTLLETPPSWRLDDHTRAVGRRGVAAARASLQAALAAARHGDDATAEARAPSDRSAA